VHQSGGNPYFLTELSRAGLNDPSCDLVTLVRARVQATVSPIATQVLQAAAVLVEELSFSMLLAASGRSEEETLDALDALLRAGVLAEQEGSYRFVHPLVASVVAGDLSQARRQFLHRRVAQALERTHAQREMVAARLAMHFAAANELSQAAHYAELAARHALTLTGWVEATAYARQALGWATTPERALLLGELLTLGGEDEAIIHLEAARVGFAQEANAPGEARACLQLARRSFLRGQLQEASAWLAQAPLAAAQQEEPSIGVEAQMQAAGVERQRGNEAEAERLLQRALEVALSSQLTHLAALVAFERGNLLADRGDLAGAQAAFAEALAGAQATNNRVLETSAYNNLAFGALRAGDLDAAERHLARAREDTERYAIGFMGQYVWSTAGELALAHGQLEEADAAFVRSYEAAQALGNQVHQANVRLNQADVALARGEHARAKVLVGEAEKLFGQASDPFLREKLRRMAARLDGQQRRRDAD
jgi:hypothetical protein